MVDDAQQARDIRLNNWVQYRAGDRPPFLIKLCMRFSHKLLSEVSGAKIDEVFIGSCMTNIGHFRAAAGILDGKSDLPTR